MVFSALGALFTLIVFGRHLADTWHGLWSRHTSEWMVVSLIIAVGIFLDMSFVGVWTAYLASRDMTYLEYLNAKKTQ